MTCVDTYALKDELESQMPETRDVNRYSPESEIRSRILLPVRRGFVALLTGCPSLSRRASRRNAHAKEFAASFFLPYNFATNFRLRTLDQLGDI
jgi:hypothetical protein